MSKIFWVNARPFNKKVVTTALESGAEAVIVPKGQSAKVRALGLIKTVAADGDLKLGEDVVEVTVNSQKDEAKAIRVPAGRLVIIKTGNWKVIPLENLISKRKQGLLAWVRSAEEAGLALKIMERGVDGVVLDVSGADKSGADKSGADKSGADKSGADKSGADKSGADKSGADNLVRGLSEIKKTAALIRAQGEKLKLIAATIKSVKALGMGDRVCVDTITNLKPGQGMLVGNSSSGMFLVYAENVETPYCATRPFRVNAGAVHAYIRVSDGKTAYLADLSVGDPVLVVDSRGATEVGFVGRAKVEKRPMMLVEAVYKGRPISLVLQNAETIRLTRPSGEPVSITTLKPGDKVLALEEEAGRHFGVKIKETIVEK